MKLDTLDALNDGELQAVIARAEALLKQHDDERKAKALGDARAMQAKTLSEVRALLASVGLSLKDAAGGKGAKHTKSPAYRGGQIYHHPANKALTWNAKGQKPGWLRELEAQGVRPIEVQEPANDNAPLPVRKTG